MTREEIIDGMKAVDKECGKHLNEGFAWMSQIINEAIKALEQEPTISEDGTLTVQVKDGKEVNRVLVCGDNHWGGLYYAEDEPCEDAKHKLIKDCQPPTDDWEHYADRLHDIAYKYGYGQAQRDMAEQEHCKKHDDYWINLLNLFPDDKEHICECQNARTEILGALLDKTGTDCISRQAVIEYIKSEEADLWHKSENETVCENIMRMPSVSPAKPKGKWIIDGAVDCYLDKARCHCSECGKKKEFPANYDYINHELSISYKNSKFIDKYCPNCGCQMER